LQSKSLHPRNKP
jgi:hypothetical protein